jgi:RHS repeat-associated protein
MVRPRNPETMGLLPYSTAHRPWFDYDGDEIYGDLSVSYDEQTQTVTATDLMAHEPGLAQYEHATEALHHLHGNLIGTTERMTDAAGAIAHRAVYTAFGELIDESGAVATRYGYAGAYGYQSASSQKPIDPLAELGWLHVGERYYDPSTGRFVQRDPIGISGGFNTYQYVASQPATEVDPSGLNRWYRRTSGHSEVWFSNPCLPGTFICYDFGPSGGVKKIKQIIPCAGQVNRLETTQLPDDVTEYPSTPAQDAEDHARIEYQVKNPPRFSITGIRGQNCWGGPVFWARHRRPGPLVGGGGIPPPNTCFVAETLVSGPDGPICIQDIALGDTLKSHDWNDALRRQARVHRVCRTLARDFVVICLDGEEIQCTASHPFWTNERGWVEAGSLTERDTLFSANGNAVGILRIGRFSVSGSIAVYNMEVDDTQCYFVGRAEVLVHNKNIAY